MNTPVTRGKASQETQDSWSNPEDRSTRSLGMRSAVRKLSFDSKAILAIVAGSAVVHGLLLLNDGVYWDGWLVHTHVQDNNWSQLYSMFREPGAPLTAYFHWFVGHLPNEIFAYKALAFLSIALSGILVYLICSQLRLLSRAECLLIALVALAYPAFQVSVDLINIPSLVYYCLFFTACFAALRSERASGRWRYGLRLVAWILWLISFTVISLVAFYCGFIFILALLFVREHREPPQHVFTRFLPKHIDYVAFPLVYLLIMRHFFPPHGLYSDYTRISFNPIVFAHFIDRTIFAQLGIALANLGSHMAIAVPVLAIFALVLVTLKVNPMPALSHQSRRNRCLVLAMGFLLLFLGILPYAAGNRVPALHGWQTRHSLLIALPMAIILASAAFLLFSGRRRALSKIGVLFLLALLLAFTLSSIANYFSWQARWVKDRSVMENLASTESLDNVSIVWVDDQYQVGGEPIYRFYEWSSMFKEVWGDESRIGLDQEAYSASFLTEGTKYFNDRYNLSDFDPAGPQAILTIQRGPNAASDAALSTQYLFYRLFQRDKLPQFLVGITSLEVRTA